MLSIAARLRLRLGSTDYVSAFIQSGDIQRELYVRPPRELSGPRGSLWQLHSLPYGIAEANRKWSQIIDHWLINKLGFLRVPGLAQLYVRYNPERSANMVIAKVTDDLLIAGSCLNKKILFTSIKQRFNINKEIMDSEILFNGAFITQDSNFNVTSF